MEHALVDAGSLLQLFVQQIPARACVIDRDFRVVWDLGVAFPSSPSAVGKSVAELFADSPDRERVIDGCHKALAGESVELEIDDRRAAAHLKLVPFRDADGGVTGVVGIAFDITERVRSEEEVRQGRRLLQQVLDLLPVGVVVIDPAGDVLHHNAASGQIWDRVVTQGQERWVTSKATRHGTGQRIAPDEWASRRALVDGTTTRDELLDIETFDGRRKTIENYAAPIRDGHGAVTGAVVVNEDVTERVLAEEGLLKTQRLLVDAEKLGQTGSWEQNLVTGEIFNTEESRQLFFGDDSTKGTQLDDYARAIHPDDRDRVLRGREALLAGTGSGDVEFRVVWPDGSVHLIFGRATVVRDDSGRPIRVYGTNADITERRRSQNELARRAHQLESLTQKLIQAQEAERRALANELHDDLGQILFALKLNLERSGQGGDNLSLVDSAIARIRDVVQALRPPLLDELGLEASLRWYVEREAARVGLAVRLALGPLEARPAATVETTAFRVAQEALSNVIRHAQARVVDVELSEGDGVVQLVVRDDGRGFAVATARQRAAIGASQGLLSMQERVALVGGELEIDSGPGRGTSIRARLPLTPTPDPGTV